MVLKKEFAGLPEEFVVLVNVEGSNYNKKVSELFKDLDDKETGIIYVTANKTYDVLKTQLLGGKDSDSVFFIDLVSKKLGSINNSDNCFFIDSPEHLTELGIVINQVVKSMKMNNKFLFFDSLSTLTLYNNQNIVTKFGHFLISKIKSWGISGIIIMLNEEKQASMKNQISQFCDKTIELGR